MNIDLSRNAPRLIELTETYSKLGLFDHSFWSQWADNIPIEQFRGEIGYMSQLWNMTPERYQNTFDYLSFENSGIDALMRWLGENDSFGCITFERNGTVFSRDLIDSICEMRFMMDVLDLKQGSQFNLLDIGSGYGRLLYRCSIMFPYGNFFGVDGVPLSTFLCEFYLRHLRQIGKTVNRAYTVPLHELDRIPNNLDIACNIQSFSEMPYSAVKFWLDLCADLNIKHFFLSPHSANLVDAHFVTSEPGGGNRDYYPLFAEHGYKEIRRWHKFPPDWSKPLIYNTEFIMFMRG